MSRRDPGAATGGAVYEPGRCACGALEPVHTIVRPGQRGGCPATGCKRYEPASNVIAFPGVGITPAPAGPPQHPADLDAIGERYVAYAEAVATDDPHLPLLARVCADDVPALRDEIHRLTVALEAHRG